MEFETFVNKDITVHTDNHKFRGILVEVMSKVVHGIHTILLVFKMGIDDFYLDAHKVIGVTVHGMEHD